MAEYIEREALCKILENWRDAHADVDDEQGCGLLEDVICEVNAQTAADVAPVVRCKDCKFRNTIICPMVHETMGNGTTDYATDDGYCDRGSGKRKDGAE